MKKQLLVLVGPTATGKTDLSIKLCQKLNGEVVSADSMLVYKGMNIGTAKPTIEECNGIKHWMIDIISPNEEYSVARYQQDADKAIEEIQVNNKLPLLVGGTGLYVRGVIDEYSFATTFNDLEAREKWQKILDEKGKDWVYDQLVKIDPIAANGIHPNNVRRVIRALAVYDLTGKPFSSFQKACYQFKAKYDVCMFGLKMSRDLLYYRINARVDKMFQDGLINEVKKLSSMGLTREMTSMQGIGYKEVMSYLSDELSLEETVELIKKNTRHFAKRQFTWFGRDPRIHWIELKENTDNEYISRQIVKMWQEKFCVASK